MKRLLLTILLLTPLCGFSQIAKSRPTLYTQVDTQLPTNSSGAITAAVLRGLVKDIIASAANALSDPAPVLTSEMGFGVDGGGSVIVAVTGVPRPIAYPCTITGWQIVGDVSGSITVDVEKGTPIGGAITFASITASAPITLTSQQYNASATLTGWTTAVAAGDVLRIKVTGTPVAIKEATIIFTVTLP